MKSEKRKQKKIVVPALFYSKISWLGAGRSADDAKEKDPQQQAKNHKFLHDRK